MQKSTILILIAFSSLCLNAQTNLDSLYGVWKDKTVADSSRISALDDYIWFGLVFSQPEIAIALTDTLFEFSRKRSLKGDMASALSMKAAAYQNMGDYVASLKYNQRCLDLNTEIGDKNGIANSLNNIGVLHKDQGEYIKALEYYQKSLKIKEEIGDKRGIAVSLNNIGLIFSDQGENVKALEFYQESLKLKMELSDKKGSAITLNNIGTIYNVQEEYDKALEHFYKSLNIFKKIGYKQGIALSLNNIGLVHSVQGENINAFEYYQKSLKIYTEVGHKLGSTLTLNRIGELYLKQGNNLKAIANCKRGLDLAIKIGAVLEQKGLCACLYDAYKAQGNGNKALAYHEQMLVLADSLQAKETIKGLQQMEFSKQVLADSLIQIEKDMKVEMAHQTEVRKKDKNKNIAIGAGIFLLILSAGLFSRWRYVKKSKAVIEKEKDRSENLLLNILPAEIAEELKLKGRADARDFDMVSILFTDFKSFTETSGKLTAKELIGEINHCFEAFDHICEKYGIEKIKTIGDAYMAAGGLPVPSENSLKNTVLAAIEMQAFISNRIEEKNKLNEMSFKMRLGIHTGPVVAGIVGVKKFQYDIWGDTVNTASRMESSGEIGKVNISESTYELLKNEPEFSYESRGKIEAKGKGEMEMYFVETKLK